MGLSKDMKAIGDFYGGKGYIDVIPNSHSFYVQRVPNTETGTMDLEFQIDEGQKNYIEKIEIRGNTKTKDRVIRRELAVSPGETFDMVRVNVSQRRLEGLQYFEKVDMRPEPTEVSVPQKPDRRRRGKEHRQSDHGRRIQLRGFDRRLRGSQPG